MQQSILNFKPELGSNVGPSPYLGNWVFDCKAAREAFIKKMIIDQDPFCEFQKPGWKLLISVILPPYFHLPGRSQFTRDCISMYEKLKGELREFFTSTNQRASLTTDTWSDWQNGISIKTEDMIAKFWSFHFPICINMLVLRLQQAKSRICSISTIKHNIRRSNKSCS